MNFLYELLLKIISIARGYILCPPGSVQNNTYQNRKAPFEESGAETSPEADRQRGKARRYRLIRIVFIIFIILLCLIMMLASPLRVFAIAYETVQVVELILSSVAFTTISAAASAPLVGLIVGMLGAMAVSLTVEMVAKGINTAVECGLWEDFYYRMKDGFEVVNDNQRENGTMALVMGGTAFLYAYDWVKEHILGISLKSDSDNVNKFDGMTSLGTHIYKDDQLSFLRVKINDNLTYQEFFNHRPGIGTQHSVDIISGNLQLRFTSNLLSGFSFDYHGDVNKYIPKSPIVSTFFSPIFTAKEVKIAEVIEQQLEDMRVIKYNQVSKASLSNLWYTNSKNEQVYCDIEFDSNNGYVAKPYDSYIYQLKLKDGSILYKFKSLNDFAYRLFYEAVGISCIWRGNIGQNLGFDSVSSTVAKPFELPVENKKYYDKDRDTIATTAGSVRTKVKDGSITSDTDGKVSVKVNSPAIPAEGTATAVTPTTKINESVKVTDISTTLQGVQTMNPGDAITIGSNNIMLNASAYNDKLPFSGLKSISELSDFFLVKSLKDDMPKAPLIPINFTVPVINESIKFDINFACLDPYISLIRLGFAVEFCISMYLSFKKWLMNKEV